MSFMYRLRRMFYGRYGFDQLSMALLILGIILAGLGLLLRLPFLRFLYYICLVLCLLRAYSRNTHKRWSENHTFLAMQRKIVTKTKLCSQRLRDIRTYKYVRCPGCGQTLRVPRGKGKVNISCGRCHLQFLKKV